MIEEIRIEGLGVIEKATVPLGPQLTAITGETGAGKSMLLQSLSLISGARADARLVRYGHEACRIDGIFQAQECSDVCEQVEQVGGVVDDDHMIYMSRHVIKGGRSRAYVNGRPVPAGVLAELSENLINVHGQADQYRLLKPASQRMFLDAYAGITEDITTYQHAYDHWIATKKARRIWKEQAQQREEEKQHLIQGLDIIEKVNPLPHEDNEVAKRIERLMNSEDVRQALTATMEVLSGNEEGAVATPDATQLLSQARNAIDTVAHIDPELQQLCSSINQIDYLLQDVTQSLASYLAQLDADPYALEQAHQRLSELKDACSTRADNVDELLEWAEKAAKRLHEIDNPDNTEQAWNLKVDQAYQDVITKGQQISRNRRKAALDCEKNVNAEIHALAMPDADLFFDIAPLETPQRHGLENVEIYMRPHAKAPRVRLSQGASGGELSRVMLALEVSALRKKKDTKDAKCPTLVFDEVDAGVGGHTATIVAQRLAQLAKQRQVVVVTHLAQVAAAAHMHVVVTKQDGETTVKALDTNQRVAEIARMLGGDESSQAARAHACELLEQW
ncbi:MAG: DNA repair protein RecN [Actinomycetaceae bacterium]|nr:DNA repair protein RecN [Actinomycetaceae bacterium]